MSIYKAYQTPVALIRSLFFLFALSCSILLTFPIIAFAEESQETGIFDTEEDNQGEEPVSAVFTQNIYHKHTGSSGGGGCYSVRRSGTTTKEIDCGGSMIYYPAQDESKCDRCYAGYSGDHSYRKCWHTKTETTSYTYYDLGCGKSPSTLLGTVFVEQSTADWVKSLYLTASYEVAEGMTVSELPYIWNGGEAVAENVYEVTANGDYTLQLNADANSNTEAGKITVSIKNIDVTPPVVHSHTISPEGEWTKEGVLVTLGQISDLQPDGSEGCGLHEMPYSYDLGQTWTQESSFLYNENGTHTILIRDKLKNTASYEAAFFNIDMTPPTIEKIEYDDTKNVRTTTLSVSINDLQADGTEGCGLHEEPYSFDGGKTWGAEASLQVDENGTIVIAVRDKLENTAYQEVDITNIDCVGPSISYQMVHDSWTNQDVTLYLHAQDKNADGSDGIGLMDNWYSLDDGRTWMNTEALVYESNQEVGILARDKHNNLSRANVSIRQIDKELPWVSLSMEIIGEGKEKYVLLTAYGGDDYSGLHEEGYSWDKGGSYGKEQTMVITENGLYQVRVRDKAGNWDCDNIEVDVFEIEETEPEVKKKESVKAEEPATEQEPETEENTEEPVIIKAKKMKEKPVPVTVEEVEEEKWGLKECLLIVCGILFLAALVLLILLLLMRTVVICAEDEKGKMQFIGLQWIHCKEERYEVRFSEMLLEQCVTTHFSLRPGALFVLLHKDALMCCLFPEDICITLSVEKEMDFSLL